MLWLGIDGGGTKTEAALCDGAGRILRHAIVGASAPSSVPRDQLAATFTRLLSALDIPPDQPVTAFGGISGCIKDWDRAMFEEAVFPLLPENIRLRVGGDGACGLNAAFGPSGDGLLMIVGTGSTLLMRKDGQCSEIGGWGYLLGDEGSGYDMGRRAVTAALRAYDGRGEQTLLTRLLEQKAGVPIGRITDQLYASGRRGIASCAGVLIQAAMAGDDVARTQMDECVAELRLHISVARRRAPNLRLAVSGGLPSRFPYLWEKLTNGLDDLRPMLLTRPPVYGAVLEAMGRVPDGFAEAFDHDYLALGAQSKEGQ